MPDDELDPWADVRRPAGETARAQINAPDLAKLIARQGGYKHGSKSEKWDDLESHEQALRVRAAERLLVEIGARDLSDPQRALIARIRSAGDHAVSEVEDAAERISSAVDEALGAFDPDSPPRGARVVGWVEGVRYVIAELDAHGLADVYAGGTPLDEALRAFAREADSKESRT